MKTLIIVNGDSLQVLDGDEVTLKGGEITLRRGSETHTYAKDVWLSVENAEPKGGWTTLCSPCPLRS